jgi:hypothetical protein
LSFSNYEPVTILKREEGQKPTFSLSLWKTDNLRPKKMALILGTADVPVPKTVYIAGKMSGIENLNKPKFDQMARMLKSLGYVAYTPHDINEGRDHKLQKLTCMESDLEALMRCECICLLPGWRDSTGAKLEYEVAKYFRRKKVVFHRIQSNKPGVSDEFVVHEVKLYPDMVGRAVLIGTVSEDGRVIHIPPKENGARDGKQ